MEIVWRAFELRPEPVPTLDPNGEYLHRVWSSSVYPLAERLNITIKLPPVQPRSRRAHEAVHWAKHQGRFSEYNEALYRAFFERGEDISNIDVLSRLASDVGLDSSALRQALDNMSTWRACWLTSGRQENWESVPCPLSSQTEKQPLAVCNL